MKFHEKEIKLTNDIIGLLEWTEKKLPQSKTNVLFCNYFPVMINKTHAINLTRNEEKIKDIDYAFFRPMRNGKHCQLMVDGAYEVDDSIEEIITVKDPKTRRISGYLRTNEGDTIKISKSVFTESEFKFAVLYLYWFGEDISESIIEIHEFNDKYKMEQNEKTTRSKNNKSKLKLPRMN